MSLNFVTKLTRVLPIKSISKKNHLLVRGLLTGVFIYFVSMMIVMGNGSSFLGRYLSFLYIPIANTIGLNTTWNFFSPDPANTMYILISYTRPGTEEFSEILPSADAQGRYDFSLKKRRLSYIVRFLIIDPEKIEKYLAPWLCQQKPEFESIYIETIIEKIPSLDKAVTLKESIFSDLVEKQVYHSLNYNCHKTKVSNEET